MRVDELVERVAVERVAVDAVVRVAVALVVRVPALVVRVPELVLRVVVAVLAELAVFVERVAVALVVRVEASARVPSERLLASPRLATCERPAVSEPCVRLWLRAAAVLVLP